MLNPPTLRRSLAALLLLVALGACAAAPRVLSTEQYRARLPDLEARADQQPHNPTALRDFGEALVQTRAYARALDPLQRARALAPDDPKTLYYLAAAREATASPDSALALYALHAGLADSPYQRLMHGRHVWLRRERVREQIAALIETEAEIETGDGDLTEAVAVFPFSYGTGDPRYAPLGRGLSEMITTDLAALGGVRLVERVRLQVLLDELALAEGGAFDAQTAPRVGRLLRSGRIVGGGVDVQAEQLAADVALWEWAREREPEVETRGGPLAELFRVQQEIVFGLADALGVRLTASQRARIEEVPTRSLQAFLAYSRGLQEEDAGRFASASSEYREAERLDGGFAEASSKAEAMEAASLQSGALPQALLLARAPESDLAPVPRLVGLRLGHMGATLGTHTVPSEEQRDPTAEVAPTLPTIPDPPPPPSGN